MHWTRRQAQWLQGCFWEVMGNPLPPAQVSSDSKAGEEGTSGRAQAVTGVALKLERSQKGRLSWEILVAQGGSCSSVKSRCSLMAEHQVFTEAASADFVFGALLKKCALL